MSLPRYVCQDRRTDYVDDINDIYVSLIEKGKFALVVKPKPTASSRISWMGLKVARTDDDKV